MTTEAFAVWQQPSFGPEYWDAWVTSHQQAAGYCQTSDWARVLHSQSGVASYALTVPPNKDKWAAGAMFSYFTAESGNGRGGLNCVDGPVLPQGSLPEDLGELLVALDGFACTLDVSVVNFSKSPIHAHWSGDDRFHQVFEACGYHAKSWSTFLVDLTRDEDDLLAGTKHAARKGVRKCRKSGITVLLCRSSEEFINDFYKSYYEGELEEGDHRLCRARDWWSIDGGRHYRFFTAKDAEGRVLATLGTYSFGRIATEIMSSRTKVGQVCGLPAQDLLHWEIFCAHKAAGDEAFNLGGVNPFPKDRKEEGIFRFKEKWGGRRMNFKMYSKRFDPHEGLQKRIHQVARTVWHVLRGKK